MWSPYSYLSSFHLNGAFELRPKWARRCQSVSEGRRDLTLEARLLSAVDLSSKSMIFLQTPVPGQCGFLHVRFLKWPYPPPRHVGARSPIHQRSNRPRRAPAVLREVRVMKSDQAAHLQRPASRVSASDYRLVAEAALVVSLTLDRFAAQSI